MKLRNLKVGLLMLGAIAQTVPTETLATNFKTDTVLPTEKEALTLLEAVCGQGNVAVKGQGADKNFACKTCPSFIKNEGLPAPFTLEKVVYGSFSEAGTREVLADFSGCEPHAANWGGSVLLRRSSRGWSMVTYESGLRSSDCLKFPSQNNRDFLVCLGGYVGMGYVYQSLQALEIGATQVKTDLLLRVSSNVGTCKPPFYDIQIVDWMARDRNNDGRPDLVIKVTEARETKATSTSESSECEERKLPNPTIHQLTFLFDGQSFRPTPETAQLKLRLDTE